MQYVVLDPSHREEYSSKADGFLERLLKCIHSFIKYQRGIQDIINEAKDYFSLIEAFKKEFKVCKPLLLIWLAILVVAGHQGGVAGITWACGST